MISQYAKNSQNKWGKHINSKFPQREQTQSSIWIAFIREFTALNGGVIISLGISLKFTAYFRLVQSLIENPFQLPQTMTRREEKEREKPKKGEKTLTRETRKTFHFSYLYWGKSTKLFQFWRKPSAISSALRVFRKENSFSLRVIYTG